MRCWSFLSEKYKTNHVFTNIVSYRIKFQIIVPILYNPIFIKCFSNIIELKWSKYELSYYGSYFHNKS